MQKCKDCKWFSFSKELLQIECKLGIYRDGLYDVNSHRLTRRDCEDFKWRGRYVSRSN